jgi:hypothetical protein
MRRDTGSSSSCYWGCCCPVVPSVKGSGPFGITVAPNGDPWYTMMAANKVATLQLRLVCR